MDNDDGALFPASSPTANHFPFATPATTADVMCADWATALAPFEPTLHSLADRLSREHDAGHQILPQAHHILRAFELPLEEVKVLIVGQDPYPTPGHAVGLSFSVAPGTRPIPRSLVNIYKEMASDLGVAAPANGDLSGWAGQGVLLLNRVLTVRAGESASHRGMGWESITTAAVEALMQRESPLVAVLWGRDALALKPLLGNTPVVESAHPSPLSASRGFFGSRPFSRVNKLLEEQDADPIDWLAATSRQ